MKRLSLVVAVAAMLSLALMAGCNQTKPLSPAQIAAIACPQLDLVHTQLAAFNAALQADPATAAAGLKAANALADAQKFVTPVCTDAAAAPTVDASSIQTLVQSGLPALGALVGSLPLPATQEEQIHAALVLAETAAGVVGVVEQQIQAAQAAPAPAASTVQP
jgi:hypothetical protein